jgi:hypothetical protein
MGSYHEHFVRRTPTKLTDHERVILCLHLDPNNEEERKLGERLACSPEWEAVFRKVDNGKN